MKKIYQIIILCTMGVALVGCEGISIGNSNVDYKEACEQGDFQKAYAAVNKLKKEMQDFENRYGKEIRYCREGYWNIGEGKLSEFENLENNYKDAEYYVVLQEATYILESQGLDGLVKIAMIVKEHHAEWVYDDLIDIAVAMGNDELVDRMKKLAGSTSGESTDEQ